MRPFQWTRMRTTACEWPAKRWLDEMMRLVLLLLITSAPALPGNPEPVEVRRGEDRIDIFVGGRPFTAYYYGAGAAKPFLFPLRSAEGTIVTRAFPMEDIPG